MFERGSFVQAQINNIIDCCIVFHFQVPDGFPLSNFIEMKAECSPQYSNRVNGFLVTKCKNLVLVTSEYK